MARKCAQFIGKACAVCQQVDAGGRAIAGSLARDPQREDVTDTVVGVFEDRAAAVRAASLLLARGVPRDRLTLLVPGDAGRAVEAVSTTEAEPPGVGRALGGVIGGAAGATTGIQAGVLTSRFVPGVGPVVALGVLGALVLGAAGAAIGGALEDTLQEGLPNDEIFVYEDSLRRGRSVVVAAVEDRARRRGAAGARRERRRESRPGRLRGRGAGAGPARSLLRSPRS